MDRRRAPPRNYRDDDARRRRAWRARVVVRRRWRRWPLWRYEQLTTHAPRPPVSPHEGAAAVSRRRRRIDVCVLRVVNATCPNPHRAAPCHHSVNVNNHNNYLHRVMYRFVRSIVGFFLAFQPTRGAFYFLRPRVFATRPFKSVF